MKYQVLFMVWALLAAHVSCAAVEPVKLRYYDGTETANNEERPIEIVVFGSDTSSPLPREFRYMETFSRDAVADTVLVDTARFTGRATSRISTVRWTHLTNLGQTARIIAGGVNSNSVTVEIRSARGRGYKTQVEIWGSY